MEIRRATNATFLNEVCNHPDVRPFLFGRGKIDLTSVIENNNNVAFEGQYGGMVFTECVPGVVEIHTQVLPDGRGAWAYQMALLCVDWMFCRTRTTEVFMRVPEGNVGAMALARACGARVEEVVMQDLGAGRSKVSIYGGRIQDWIKIAPGLVERGQRFHSKLREKAQAIGLPLEPHDEDPWHDRHVGAAVGMFTGGQPIKGMLVFNRYCAMAMAPFMRLISLDPLVVDIHDCRLEVLGDDFEVVPCQ